MSSLNICLVLSWHSSQMAIECHFVRAAKALASLHICTGLPKPSSLYKISCAALNGDLCAIHASSEYSGESVHLRRHSHWTMRLVSRSIVFAA